MDLRWLSIITVKELSTYFELNNYSVKFCSWLLSVYEMLQIVGQRYPITGETVRANSSISAADFYIQM